MAWVKFTDDFDESPKFDHVGALGMALWVAGMAYCNRKRTDGEIHRRRALRLIHFDDITYLGNAEPAPLIIALLLEAGLWHEQGHDCPRCVQPGSASYVVHDYLDFQPSRQALDEKAAEEAKRKADWRAKQKAASTSPDDVPTGQAAGQAAGHREESRGESGDRPAVGHGPVTPPPVPVPEPVPEPLLKDSRASRSPSDKSDLPERFEEFWDVYGKKTDRKRAVSAYRSALKKKGITPDLLIAAARQYVAWVKSEGKFPKYAKDAATWLNGENWTDERSGREARGPSDDPNAWMRRRLTDPGSES